MMQGDEPTRQSFSWARRWSALLNLLITIAAVLALVAMVNYLSIRHYTRFHWNRDSEAGLSPRTRQVLSTLTNTVKVTVYYDAEDPLFPRIKGLLKEYQFASRHLQAHYVDYKRDWVAAEKLKQDYKLPPGKKDVVIFDAGGTPIFVNFSELSDYDVAKMMSGESKDFERTHFKGELLFTSKIYAVANGRSTVAYYLLDHGEHLVGGNAQDGYDKFLALLHDENNFEVRPLRLGGTNGIPADCQLLIIASPNTPLAGGELDRIQNYLEQGGRALITFRNLTVASKRRNGLENLLARWGVEVGENIVRDQEHAVSSSGWDVVPVDLGSHPIVNPLRGLRVLLYMPRSIRAIKPGRGRAEDAKVDELLFTGTNSVVVTDVARAEFDPAQSGTKPLMAVVEKSVPALQRGSTRIAVLGDSTLWGNEFMKADGNQDFAAATANWLVNQSVLLNGIAPRPLHTYRITMTHSQMRSVQLALLLGLPGGVLLLGLLVWLRRRH